MDEKITRHPGFIAFSAAESKPVESVTVKEEGKDKEVEVKTKE